MGQEEELGKFFSKEVEEKAKASSSSPRGAGSAALIMHPALLQKKKHTTQKIQCCQPTSAHNLTF